MGVGAEMYFRNIEQSWGGWPHILQISQYSAATLLGNWVGGRNIGLGTYLGTYHYRGASH